MIVGSNKGSTIVLLTSRTKEQRQKISEAYQSKENNVRKIFYGYFVNVTI
jgi:hypothetical protein